MNPILNAAIAGVIVWNTGAIAQPAAESLPLGLDLLHWQMTSSEVAAQLSTRAPRIKAPDDSPLTDQAASHFGPYRWRDCVFNISLYFSKDQLDDIDLDARAVSPACQSAMKEELATHYGDGKETDQRNLQTNVKFAENIKWTSPQTAATYNAMDDGRFAEISLSDPNGQPLMIYDPVRGSR